MAEENRVPQVTQIAGPGISGTEDEPPVYHFDVPAGDVDELIRDPTRYLAKIGLSREQHIAPRGEVRLSFLRYGETWVPGRGWEDRELPPDPEATRQDWCCHASGGDCRCHSH